MYSLSFILLLLPVLFQLIYGSIAINGNTRLNFLTTNAISLFLSIIVSIIGLIQTANELKNENIKCGTPQLGYVILALAIFFILLVIIVFQTIIKYFRDKKTD